MRSPLNIRMTLFLLRLGWGVLLAFSTAHALADDTQDEQVWAALKEGGKVVLLRHAHVVIGEGIGRLAPGNCAQEINLTPRGIAQAKRLGEAFRTHGIPVGDVRSSPYCRCLDTGRLAFGRATAVPYLAPPGTVSDSQAASNHERVMQEIRSYRGASNLVMITHDLNIANVVLEPTIAMGEFFVLEPKGGDFTVVGKIQLPDN